MAAVKGGLIIGTDDEIYSYYDGILHLEASYGVVPGHNKDYTQDGQCFFWSKRGVCSGLPFRNHTDDTYSVPHGTRAGVKIVELSGRKTLIACLTAGGTANNPYS